MYVIAIGLTFLKRFVTANIVVVRAVASHLQHGTKPLLSRGVNPYCISDFLRLAGMLAHYHTEG